LKRLYHKKVLLWLIALSPNASLSIQWVSAAVLLSLKRNLMQILCSLKSAVSVGEKKNRRTTKTRHYRNARNSRTRPLSLPAVGTLIHKGYCSAHLAAEVRTTTGSRARYSNSPNFWVAPRIGIGVDM
jgi:hypothetical protein